MRSASVLHRGKKSAAAESADYPRGLVAMVSTGFANVALYGIDTDGIDTAASQFTLLGFANGFIVVIAYSLKIAVLEWTSDIRF
jgi:hypothetical protein